jgi:carbamoyl-phosphate synthase large subunit
LIRSLPARGSDTGQLEDIPLDLLRAFKEAALSDRRLAYLTSRSEDEVRAYRKSLGLIPVYKRVDTCGAEFESYTPYLYSTYEEKMKRSRLTRRRS